MARLVTVFGGSGFVGGHVVRALAGRGWRIRVACRKPHTAQHLLPMTNPGQIQLKYCDIRDPAQVEAALDGADAAINLVGLLFERPGGRFQAVHVDGARTIAEACAAHGVADLVQFSAIGADAASEADYARTKGEAEAAVLKAVPTATILRPSIVFGPGDGFFNRFAAMATMAPALPLIGGGETRFQPVYVGDVAEAAARVLDRPETRGRIYELAGPATYSFRELLEQVLTVTRRQRFLVPVPWLLAGPLGWVGDVMAFVGVTPPVTSDQLRLLKADNVAAEGAEGLRELGVEAEAVEAIIPAYLWRYRDGGQFSDETSPRGVATA
ncbi:MAG TPA: complex I NDUFA9 subunit family protein [Caulobacteraceae bacterium]|jgi:NADH dehydrogenase